MAIRSLKTGQFSRSALVGNPVIMPGSYESIATVTVGAGGSSTIEFTSIPSTFTHLQVRILARTNAAAAGSFMQMTFNNATTNMKAHYLDGNGSAASAAWENTGSAINFGSISGGNATSGIFGVAIIDILDYANTNKNKVTRHLDGNDRNGAGNMTFRSGLWISTSAITSLKITPGSGTSFAQYSSFALYGVN